MDARFARILTDRPDLSEAPDDGGGIRDRVLRVSAIVATMATIIVAYFVFASLTRDGGDSTATLTTTAPQVQPPQVELGGVTQPAHEPSPAEMPAPASVSSASPSLSHTPPVSEGGSVQPEKQVGGLVTGAQGLVPKARNGPIDLAEKAEKTAVSRASKQAAINAPRRAAQNRRALTDEEKAAVERGLRELEKAAQQAKP